MVLNESATEESPSSESHESNPESDAANAGIRYRVEYCDKRTGDIIRALDVKNFDEGHESGSQLSAAETIFVLLRKYEVKSTTNPDEETDLKKLSAIQTYATPSYHIRIVSMAVINALRSVVRYYPGQDLSGDTITIRHPYLVLVHHFEELATFRDKCATVPVDELCQRERYASAHLTLLLDYLDANIMPEVRLEQDRWTRGYCTWEYQWLLFKPGATVLNIAGDTADVECRPSVVESVRNGIFEDPPGGWILESWMFDYSFGILDRRKALIGIPKWDGERPLKFRVFDTENILSDGEAMRFVESGKLYWNLMRKQCKYYKGSTTRSPFRKVDSITMLDFRMFQQTDKYRKYCDQIELQLDDDLRVWQSDCSCTVCQLRKTASGKAIASLFENYNGLNPSETETLTNHQYMLFPVEIPAFVFRTRVWEWLHVSNFSDPPFDESMINNLVMDADRVRNLKALAKSFARTNKDGETMAKEHWTADFVKGKGHGLIFLLHGKPGVGKTCTAECIAEFTKRPLMILTSSDIGINPAKIEETLTEKFKMAMSWDAVLLIDEADVFMERRSSSDLTRNSLVAGFLRALEFYDGILFLTTNRVGSFDDAFISRIHVKIYYPDFTDDQRRQVWKTFVDKLARERGDYMRLSLDAKDYMKGKEMRAVKWNGREIRNAFQTAVSLAEYDAVKDEEGKILLTDDHLRAVVELSSDFEGYLDKLHKGDEAKRAARKYERLDDYTSHEKN